MNNIEHELRFILTKVENLNYYYIELILEEDFQFMQEFAKLGKIVLNCEEADLTFELNETCHKDASEEDEIRIVF